MKITFTGTHGVGKSTLVDELLKNYPKFDKPSNFRRDMVNSVTNFNVYESATIYEQSFITGFMAYEAIRNHSFVHDRCIIDAFAYAEYANITKDDRLKLYDLYNEVIDNYDFIFYIPIEFTLECDGFRNVDTEFQKQIDDMIKYYLELTGVKYHTITGSVEERLNTIYGIIENQKLK